MSHEKKRDKESNDPLTLKTGKTSRVKEDSSSFRGQWSGTEAVTNECSREGEFTLAMPEIAPVDPRPLTEDEKTKYEAIDEEDEKRRLQRIADELVSKHSSLGIPPFLRNASMSILLGLAAAISLFLVGQIVSTWAQMATLPDWAQYVVIGILAVCGLALALVIGRLVALFLRLGKNRQIELSGLKLLESRAELRALSARENKAAVQTIITYLNDYPTTDGSSLAGTGLTDAEVQTLAKTKKELLEANDDETPQLWINSFRTDFQEILDNCAKRKIIQYMKQVALKTAICPIPLLDNAIVLTSSLGMVKDLMTLYNLRPSSGASAQILLHAIIQTYLAGEFQELTESLAESGVDILGEQFGQVFAKVTKSVGSKVGEGAANALMVRRLGNVTMSLLRPVEA